MSRLRTAATILAGAFLVHCGDDAPPQQTLLPPPQGAVAVTVENERVTDTTIATIASAQNLDPAQAVERAVFDAVLAADARKRLDERTILTLTNTVLARAALTDDWRALKDKPITALELEEATEHHWLDYARPEGRRTGHAVLQVRPDAPQVEHDAARKLVEKLRDALVDTVQESKERPKPKLSDKKAFVVSAFADDPLYKAFEKAAKAFAKANGQRFRVEYLVPVAKESWQIAYDVQWGARFDPKYVEGAWKLSQRGDLSQVVKSASGYHVIVLLEVTPAKMVPEAERRAKLADYIRTLRATRHRAKLLERLRATTRIELVPNHAALLAQIQPEQPDTQPKPSDSAGADDGE